MNYYIKEIYNNGEYAKTASSKARDDIEFVLNSLNWKKIEITNLRTNKSNNILKKIYMHKKSGYDWKNSFTDLSSGDTVLIQFPVRYHSLFLSDAIKFARKKGVRICLIVHDLDMLRYALSDDSSLLKSWRINKEEKDVLKVSDSIIVHNKAMLKLLSSLGIAEKKMVNLEIFDYIIDESIPLVKTEKLSGIIVAGNLSPAKSGYLYNIPDDLKMNLYGINYNAEKKENIRYYGSFLPNDLLNRLEGGFGLVWDGTSCEKCDGIYGEYLKVNNPHKTSLFLACGIPVIIWKEAALAEFVQKNRCGIIINSLKNVYQTIQLLSDDEYEEMCINARKISQKLRNGFFTRKALDKLYEKEYETM
jgi:hypothetical protein